MLQPDLAAQLQELLKILVGAVLVISICERPESSHRGGGRASDGLQRFDIL